MKISFRPVRALLALILLSLPSAALGQTPTATVRGFVLSSDKKPVAGAEILLVNEETNESRRSVSDAEGAFAAQLLKPGTYRIEAEVTGFLKYASTGIVLQVGQEVRFDVALQLAAPAQQVVVNATRTPLSREAAGQGTVIESRQIANLPLDGRNFLELGLLVPGVMPSAQGSPGSVRGELSINVSGAREDSNNFVLDGVYNNDPKLNSFALNPPADAIREFEIVTNSADASHGRNSGAHVNVATRSGENDFHGTVYEFLRNDALDARNFFSRSEDGAPRYQRNQFGFSAGGPLRRDRTFFFADYEGRRMREGITRVTTVPTALERVGDFSQSAVQAPIDPYFQAPFAGRTIPGDRIHPVGRRIAALYPLPNRPGAGANYVSSPVLKDRDDRFDVRVDHSSGTASSLLFRYSMADRDLAEPFSGAGFSRVPGYGNSVPRRAQNAVIGETHSFSPSLVNEARLSYGRVATGVFHANYGTSVNRAVGLPELSSNSRDHGLSLITISGFSPLGDEYNNPQHSVTNVLQVQDSLNWLKRRHLLRVGAEFRALQQNGYRDVQSRGILAFSDYGQVTGNGLADLLLGFVSYSAGARLDNAQHLRSRSWSFYLQDSYQVRRNLTLQLGVRYEFNLPPYDQFNRANVFDAAARSLVPVGTGGVPRGAYEPDRNNWGPRVGFAWSPVAGRGTVIRGGYGIYYDQASLAPGEGLYFNRPYFDFRLYYPLPGLPLTVTDPFPAYYPLALPVSATGFDRNIRTPYVQQWSFSLQQSLGGDKVFEASYVGARGTRILAARDINQPAPSPVYPYVRPLPQFDDIVFEESRGNSSWHSLQLRFQQRLISGMSALAAYTLGKSIDDTSTFFPSAGDPNFPQNSWGTGAEKARSNFDARQRFVLSFTCDLPSGPGRRYFDSGWKGTILGGWAANGILTFQTGRPFTVALLPELDNSNTGRASLGLGANDRPNRVGAGTLSDPGPDRWFDTSAFSFPSYGTFGNSGRNILDGPGYADVSISMVKDTRITGKLDLQFRSEIFNLLNRANFDLPDIYVGSPTFGQVLSAANPRRIQFGIKLLF